jgi:hypothetical protein
VHSDALTPVAAAPLVPATPTGAVVAPPFGGGGAEFADDGGEPLHAAAAHTVTPASAAAATLRTEKTERALRTDMNWFSFRLTISQRAAPAR